MKPLRIIVPFIAIALAFAGGWYFGVENSEWFQTSEADSRTDTVQVVRVIAQGRMVPVGGIVNVVIPPGQRLETLLVSAGDEVKANQTELARLKGQDALAIQSDLARSQTDDAKRELEQKLLVARNNVQAAEGAVKAAELQLQQAQKTIDLSVAEKKLSAAKTKLEQLTRLATDPTTQLYVSQIRLNDEQLNLEQSKSQLDSARLQQAAAIEAAQLELSLAQSSAEAARKGLAQLESLQSENRTLDLAQQLADVQNSAARIIAPADGTVLKVFLKEGEAAVNSPLMQIGDLSQMECVAEVVDRLAPKVQVGQKVTISSPALPRKLTGSVKEVGRVVGNGTLVDPSPLALIDRKTVDIRIEISNEDNDIASRLVNLQVNVEIHTDDNANEE
ncbi:MAG: efflux RND transporter periplasmic adaptor subunit [Pirellulaceae bacterium]